MRIVSSFLITDLHRLRHSRPPRHVRRSKLTPPQPAPSSASLLRLCLALLLVATGPGAAHTFDAVAPRHPIEANAARLAISSSDTGSVNPDGLADVIPAAPHDTHGTPLESLPVPNIVVIMTDDLNVNALTDAITYGWMPNLKSSIIDQGLAFTNSFVADSLCCPSRATLLTGQHTHNHGVLHNTYPAGGVTAFDDTNTLPIWLNTAGYRTGLVGKYFNGYGEDLDPSNPVDDPTYLPPGWDDWQASIDAGAYDYSLNDNGVLVSYGSQPSDYYTDVYAVRAADFIRDSDAANDSQPFFLLVTPNAPHLQGGVNQCTINIGQTFSILPAQRHIGIAANLPLPQPSSYNEANVSDKPNWLKNKHPPLTASHTDCLKSIHQARVESMMAVDDLIGTIVSELQALGELADTLLIFTSDNGFLMGEHRGFKKQNPYEGSVRVPLYISGPGVAVQQSATQMVVNIDLNPTLVELAQVTAGLVADGRSLVPILQNPEYSPWRSYFLVEHTSNGGIPTYSAVRSEQYKWVEYVTGERELYDFTTDPDEMTSQHSNGAYRNTKSTLKQVLQSLKNCSGAACWQ